MKQKLSDFTEVKLEVLYNEDELNKEMEFVLASGTQYMISAVLS